MIEGFGSREIFEALRNTLELDGPAAFAALEARLSDAAQKLLHRMISADEVGDEESSWSNAHRCLTLLEKNLIKKQLDDLRSRLEVAEREGRQSEALELMAQRERLRSQQRAYEGTGR
jgi:hypothetical protein